MGQVGAIYRKSRISVDRLLGGLVGSLWPPCLVLTPSRLSVFQEKRKKQAEIENKRRQLEDDRRQLQHLKVPGSGLPPPPPRAWPQLEDKEGAAVPRDPKPWPHMGLGQRGG